MIMDPEVTERGKKLGQTLNELSGAIKTQVDTALIEMGGLLVATERDLRDFLVWWNSWTASFHKFDLSKANAQLAEFDEQIKRLQEGGKDKPLWQRIMVGIDLMVDKD